MRNQIIRRGVWECNSSSSHSISLGGTDKEFVLDTIYPDQNGRVVLTGGEYGWEWDKSNDTMFKANYTAQSLGPDHDVLIQVIKDMTGAEEVVISTEEGYVDHDSYGTCPTTYDELKDFIFNKNSWWFGGNDNSRPSPTFYDVPEIKNGRIVVPEYQYVLKIEGLDRADLTFKNHPSDEEITNTIDAALTGIALSGKGFFVEKTMEYYLNRSMETSYDTSYEIPVDTDRQEIYFISGQIRIYDLEKANQEQLEGLSWDEKSKMKRKILLENYPTYVKTVKYTIEEIK